MFLSPGAWLEHYRIVAVLGVGGMGEVYLAEDTKLKRNVAIKVLPAAVSSDPDRRLRFLHEARATSALNHPNIAHIYEIGTAGGCDYLVLEYVEGETLTRRLAQGPLTVPQVIEMATQLADALEEAHGRGIVHRDLKPDNIALTPRGQAKILDFGIAKIERTPKLDGATATITLTAQGKVVGTVEYMSPEQAMAHKVDGRSDLFSLGVVLYQASAGCRPFTGRTPTEILGRIIHTPPDPLQLTGHPAAPKLKRVILKCLEKAPERRYQSAADLMKDLKALQGDAPAARSKARRLWWAAAAAAALALAAVGYKVSRPHDSSIAVLPFRNATGDPRLEYLAAGLTESLIDDLSQVPRLHVISYAGAQSYSGKDLLESGKRLKVNAVVGGTVRSNAAGQAIELTLIDTASGARLWNHQYDRSMMALIDVKMEMAREVAERVSAGRSPAGSAARKGPSEQSYDLYLKGRYLVSQRTTEAINQGLEYLRDAIAKDPSYAPAHVGLARGYVNLAFTGAQPAIYSFPLAVAAAKKALAVEPDLADAHCELGYLKAIADYDWPAAEQEFTKALTLNPNDAQTHELYAMWVLAPMGREVKAMTEIDLAMAQDPQSIMVGFHRGWILWEYRHPAESVEQFRKAIAIDPDFLIPHLAMSLPLADQRQFDAAVTSADTPPYAPGGPPRQLTTLAYMLARAGDRKRLDPLLKEIEERVRQGYVPPFWVGRIYAALGDLDRGFHYVERAYADRDPNLISVKIDPSGDVFRGDPRLDALLRNMHLQ